MPAITHFSLTFLLRLSRAVIALENLFFPRFFLFHSPTKRSFVSDKFLLNYFEGWKIGGRTRGKSEKRDKLKSKFQLIGLSTTFSKWNFSSLRVRSWRFRINYKWYSSTCRSWKSWKRFSKNNFWHKTTQETINVLSECELSVSLKVHFTIRWQAKIKLYCRRELCRIIRCW